MKSNKEKLRSALLKWKNLKVESYGYPGSFKHPKSGKRVTFSEASWYITEELDRILNKYYPDEIL